MAQKTRPGLQTTIDSNLPDNTTDFITPLLHREVEEDLKDSNFNILDDTTIDVTHNPAVPSNYNPLVTNSKEAHDQGIQRIVDLENSPAVQYTMELYANTDSTVSNIFPLYGKVLLFGDENKSSKVTSLSYEVSTDGGDTWTPFATFALLDAELTSSTTLTSFIFVRAIFTFLGGFIGEQAITLNYKQS